MSRMTPDQVKEFSHESLFFLSTMLLGYKDWDVVHDDLERFLMRPSARKAILLPRGHMKSTIVTVAYVVFRILRNPNIRVLVANQVWDMSRKFLREIKGQLEMSPLRALYGEFVSPKWNEDEIVVRQRSKSLKEPTVLTTGSEAEITGGHFDLIVLDDLTGLQNSQTPEQREKTKRFRRSMFNLLEPGSELIEIGTRWHLDDTFSVVLSAEREFYDVMVRQVVENGKIIFPKKFNLRFDPSRKSWSYVESPSMDYIDYLKKSMPLSEFNAQYMNNPIDSENAIFRASYFRYFDRRPDGLYVSMKVDPAISQKQEADYTAITVTGMDKNRDIYLLDYAQGHWSPSEIINQIFLKHGQWKPQDTGLESVGFQRTLKWALEEEMRRRGRHFGVTEVKTGTMVSKESRIKALEPYYREGKIYHAKWMQGKELETQLLTFPKSVHDDLCFVAGTRIATPFGDRDIEKIKKGDFVLTPFGVRRVLSAGLTGERDVVSHDGIVGTPNHPVFTYKNGFMSIDTLTMHDEKSKISLKEVLLWKYRKLLFSMENPIALWGRGAITSVSQQRIAEGKVRKDFMLRFGSFIRERKFVKAITFITKTGILLITTLAIWNAYRLGNTIESLKKSISNELGKTLKGFVRLQRSGMHLMKGKNGTPLILENSGKIQQFINWFVLNVESLLSRIIPQPSFAKSPIAVSGSGLRVDCIRLNEIALFAPKYLSRMEEINLEFPALAQEVAALSSPTKKEPVYNLTIQKDHVYFANDFLVSNCDSLAMHLDVLVPGQEVSKQVEQQGTWGWWANNARRLNSPYRSFYDHG